MPASSEKQKRLFDAAAHNPAFAKKVGIPTKVAKEFSKESKGMKFKEGGAMKDDMKQDKSMVKKAVGMHDKQLHGGKKTDLAKLKKGGKTSCYAGGGYVKAADGCAQRGKTRGSRHQCCKNHDQRTHTDQLIENIVTGKQIGRAHV